MSGNLLVLRDGRIGFIDFGMTRPNLSNVKGFDLLLIARALSWPALPLQKLLYRCGWPEALIICAHKRFHTYLEVRGEHVSTHS